MAKYIETERGSKYIISTLQDERGYSSVAKQQKGSRWVTFRARLLGSGRYITGIPIVESEEVIIGKNLMLLIPTTVDIDGIEKDTHSLIPSSMITNVTDVPEAYIIYDYLGRMLHEDRSWGFWIDLKVAGRHSQDVITALKQQSDIHFVAIPVFTLLEEELIGDQLNP